MSLHFLDILDFSFPISDPVLKFLIILVVILVIPILSDRLRLPHLLGMILAGVVIGPYGLNLLVFPRIARWFFKRYNDSVSQYIFVLVIVFLGAIFSQMAGIEGIIGAFMAGLALNRLIPQTSPLMNRIDFVGNAIFIPFFLIGVGMLIDYRAFTDLDTVFEAVVMSVVATGSKYMAAWITQKTFKFSIQERLLMFGLTNAQAAATLAAVLVGYNIILGETEPGEPIRLLNDSVLNGTIIMILVTCTIASFATQKAAKNIAISEHTEEEPNDLEEKILLPLSNPETIDALIDLSINIKSKSNTNGLRALNIIKNDENQSDTVSHGRKILEKAEISAAATDTPMKTILRYDLDLVHGVT